MTALSDQVAQVEADLATANAAARTMSATIEELADELATQDQVIVALRAEIERLTHPDVTETLYGVNFPDLAVGAKPGLGESRAKVARIFLQGLSGVKWANIARAQRAVKAGITTFVISWKDQDLDHVKAFLATIPDGLTIYACFNHEPENDHGDPGSATYAAWSDKWKQCWLDQSPLIRAEGFIPTQILMGWTLFPKSGRKLEEWTAPKGTVDVFGFDGYVNKFSPQDMVDAMVAATKAAGLTKTMIAETGSQITDTARTAKLVDLKQRIAAAPDAGVTFVAAIYWDDADPGFDARLNDADADVWFGTKLEGDPRV